MTNAIGTTIEQRLTCDEVCAEAASLGFHEVQTMAGWMPFTDWMPYGGRTHKSISYYLETVKGTSYIKERPLISPSTGFYSGFYFGRWPIR